MELAGRFASANHAVIHRRVAEAAGLKELAAVENHHNFAWKETLADGRQVVRIERLVSRSLAVQVRFFASVPSD